MRAVVKSDCSDRKMAQAAGASDLEFQSKDVSFSVGDSFESFDALQVKIKAYERVHFVQFWRRDSCTIEAAKKRLDRPLNPALMYYELKFCCIHGGQNFKPKGNGQRITS